MALKNNDITTNIDIDIEKYDMREWWVAPKPQHPAAEAYRSINNIYINVDIYFTLILIISMSIFIYFFTLISIFILHQYCYFLHWHWCPSWKLWDLTATTSGGEATDPSTGFSIKVSKTNFPFGFFSSMERFSTIFGFTLVAVSIFVNYQPNSEGQVWNKIKNKFKMKSIGSKSEWIGVGVFSDSIQRNLKICRFEIQ